MKREDLEKEIIVLRNELNNFIRKDKLENEESEKLLMLSRKLDNVITKYYILNNNNNNNNNNNKILEGN